MSEQGVIDQRVLDIIANKGPLITVSIPGVGSWKVPREYIAKNGLKAWELPRLAAENEWEKAHD